MDVNPKQTIKELKNNTMALGKNCSLLMFYQLLLYVMVGASASGYGYIPNPNADVSNTKNIEKEEFFPGVFSVQGVIYCKSASQVLPIKGGVVRITCLGIDKYGYETAPFSIMSRPTDANGYFLAKLSSRLLQDDDGGGVVVGISQCKAFLHSSPRLKTCPFTTDIGNGSSGAPLSAYRTVGSDGMRLYSVGPFVYSSDPPQITPSHY